MTIGNEYLTCETLTSKLTSSIKESNVEASVKKRCARRGQVKKLIDVHPLIQSVRT